jgi:hypothetical protein
LTTDKENEMPDLPAWLESLVGVAAEATTFHADPGPMGLRYREDGGSWEVLVYPLPVEVVGGAHDGGLVVPGFSLDVERLRAAFARVDDLEWNAHGVCPEGGGPCVSVEGLFRGREVWLRVFAFAPEDETPAMKLDTTGE